MPRNGCDSSNGGGSSGSGGGGDGCIYPDEVIMKKGVPFNVRYTGCVEVKTSMKSLDFHTRTLLARECINRVCEAAGLKSGGAKRRVDKKLQQYISERPCMQNAGTNVIINVSSRALTLINVETGEMVACHNMPRISFASGGDTDTLDFLAYIAKNEDEWRACYVLECINGQSEDLIVTIGKAFMLRYNALNRITDLAAENFNNVAGKDYTKDYYNDLPNKLPPDLLTDDDIMQAVVQQQQHQQKQQHMQPPHTSSSSSSSNSNNNKHQQQQQQLPQSQPRVAQLNLKKPRDRLSSNLIDLNSPPPDQTTNKMNLSSFDPMMKEASTSSSSSATGVGVGASGASSSAMQTSPIRDVFDIPPFSLTAEVQRSQLVIEQWFHAAISRPIAESLLQHDGDFLVREAQGKLGQYVLTGLEGKSPKHLLLIDPEGVVRTKDRIFDSISHLINYHWANSLPIISEDSELVLRNPVLRQNNKGNSAATVFAGSVGMTNAGPTGGGGGGISGSCVSTSGNG